MEGGKGSEAEEVYLAVAELGSLQCINNDQTRATKSQQPKLNRHTGTSQVNKWSKA